MNKATMNTRVVCLDEDCKYCDEEICSKKYITLRVDKSGYGLECLDKINPLEFKRRPADGDKQAES